jgi:MYND finger
VQGHEDEYAERVNDFLRGTDVVRESIRLFRESPAHFLEMCAEFGPKSNMASTWDAAVYAGCLENLDNPLFFWKDVHWDLDRSELLRRARDWNAALQKYCDDVGLQGEERNVVVEKHTAHPCGPCGFVGCTAIETEVREFQRCAGCRSIAYCGRSCQGRDWAEHRKVCESNRSTEAAGVSVPSEGVLQSESEPRVDDHGEIYL